MEIVGRARRKKCDEQSPSCGKCVKSKRVCSWPGKDDLLDRRHQRAFKSPNPPLKRPAAVPVQRRPLLVSELSSVGKASPFFVCREVSINTDLFNSDKFTSDLEVDCFRHFLEEFLPLLLLSSAHPGFQSAYIPEVVHMLLEFDGLRDVALACGASHLHVSTANLQMHEAGIMYYSRAVSKVNQVLGNIDWSRDRYNDAILICITFLYIHGVSLPCSSGRELLIDISVTDYVVYQVFAIGTNQDIPKHVNGAIQLMKLRCAKSQSSPLARPIHRIIWESILYQVFRQTVRHPFAVDFQPDFDFVARAEGILQALTFPDGSQADNSPVIGFPLSLQKFIIAIVQLCKRPFEPDRHGLHKLHEEMEYWEGSILQQGHCIKQEGHGSSTWTPSERARLFQQHSTSLHILAASLLLDWVSRSQEVPHKSRTNLPPPNNSWQVSRALQIMRCPQASEDWSRCYLGSWPALIFGYAVGTPENVALIRWDLEQRFRKLYSAEELEFLSELESIWRTRGISSRGHSSSTGSECE